MSFEGIVILEKKKKPSLKQTFTIIPPRLFQIMSQCFAMSHSFLLCFFLAKIAIILLGWFPKPKTPQNMGVLTN